MTQETITLLITVRTILVADTMEIIITAATDMGNIHIEQIEL